jgi:hypothetical protein
MNIFEYYGIKEVANVYFEALDADKLNPDIKKGDIVLYLDTLKVSTVETTAENVSAQGGWGNPKLITWDYGKDINVTLEDAVVSFEELRIMLGAKLKEASSSKPVVVHMSAECKVSKPQSGNPSLVCLKEDKDGNPITVPATAELKIIDREHGKRGQGTMTQLFAAAAGEGGEATPAGALADSADGDRVIVFWTEERTGEENKSKNAVELVISPDTFPGTYKVVGDALIRNKDGKDEAFQFVINKAKMLSEVTLTMQAEGDPSTFNMTLNVLRDDDGNMMSLIKY